MTTQTDPSTVGNEPPITASDSAEPTPSRQNQPNTADQAPQFQTSAQQQVDQGLAPTLGSGEVTSAFANGIVSTFPGLTSFGGQAASAAANTSKFITFYANQSIAYSDNPGNIGAGQTVVSSSALQGLNRPDFYEVTSGGFLVSKLVGQQDLFASANFGITNYALDTNFNSTRYSFSIGDNYSISDVCSGSLVANQSQSEVPLEFTIGSLSTQSTQNTSGEINSRCKVTGHIYTTADLKASRNSFTNITVLGNSSNQLLGSAGLEYSVPTFVTAGVMSSVQETSLTGPSTLGLSSQTSQIDFNAYVNKPISRKLNVSASAGIADLSSGSPNLGGQIQPIYSISVFYSYSPKTSFSVSYAHLVGSPESFIADFQQIETISAGVNYRFSPKINIGAVVSRSTTTSGGASGGVLAQLANSQTSSERFTAGYTISRDASASLSYQHTTRESGTLFGQSTANVISLSLLYKR